MNVTQSSVKNVFNVSPGDCVVSTVASKRLFARLGNASAYDDTLAGYCGVMSGACLVLSKHVHNNENVLCMVSNTGLVWVYDCSLVRTFF